MYLLFETDHASDTDREQAPTIECSSCHQQVSTAESLRLSGRCLCFNCASCDDE